MRGLSLLLVLGVSLGVAEAQPAGPAGAAPAADSADPAAGSADPAAAGGTAPGGEEGAKLRKACADAMNANPSFARTIIQTAIDTNRVAVGQVCTDADTIKAHQDAAAHVEKNQRHVLAAYAAMWAIAALFLLYLLRRQQRLKAEIAQLRRDLDAAAGEGKGGK